MFGWLIGMVSLPADSSLVWIPGTPTSPARLRAVASGASGGSTPLLPFGPVQANMPGDEQVEVSVNANSLLFSSLKVTDDYNITGLGTPMSVTVGNKVYLDIAVDNTVSISSADITIGGPWDGYPDPVHVNNDDPDNPYQDHYYQLLWEVVDPGDPRTGFTFTAGSSKVKIVPACTTNLLAAKWQVNGLACLVAQPWQGASS